ncbi:hypothetical protein SDC9_67505 [bioreactor metagenome]|uniref:Flagellin n=1 Tax=bioreactor metagenome TaxID=1076179 RepID=A0A644XXS2_9ZZZZ
MAIVTGNFRRGDKLRIFTNLSSINSSNSLKKNEKKTASSLEKLSSGLRIGKAADDAAGLAISEKMRAQIRGLSQAARNAQDGISFVQTADGGLENIQTPPLQRLRELAVQAANDTLSASDRQAIQQEAEQIKAEIMGMVKGAQFSNQSVIKDKYARQAVVNGVINIANGVSIVAGLNDDLRFTVDGKSMNFKLDAGQYSADDFVFMLNDTLWEQDPLLRAAQTATGGLQLTAYNHDSLEGFSGNAISLLYDYQVGSGGSLIGSSIINGKLTIQQGYNDELTFYYENGPHTIQLEEGTYEPDQLQQRLLDKLRPIIPDVTVAIENQKIVINSPSFSMEEFEGSMVAVNDVTSPIMDNILKGEETWPYIQGLKSNNGSITINENNNKFVFNVDGKTINYTVGSGTYTDLAALVNNINQDNSFANTNLQAEANGSYLVFRHKLAGAENQLTNISGSAYDALMKIYIPAPVSVTESDSTFVNPQIIGKKDLSSGVTFSAGQNTLEFDYKANASDSEKFTVKIAFENRHYDSGEIFSEIERQISDAFNKTKLTSRQYAEGETVHIEAGINDQLSFMHDGNPVTIMIPANSAPDENYDIDLLAQAIQSQFESALPGSIKVEAVDNKLTFTNQKLGSFGFTGGSASSILGPVTSEPTDTAQKVLVKNNSGKLILENTNMGGTLDNVTGGAVDLLMNYHYFAAPTKPTVINSPTYPSYSTTGYTARGYTRNVHQEGIAEDEVQLYSGYMIGAVNIGDYMKIDDSNDTFKLTVVTDGVAKTVTLPAFPHGTVESKPFIDTTLQTALNNSGLNLTATLSSGKIKLEHKKGGPNNSFTIDENSEFAKKFFIQENTANDYFEYIVGGQRKTPATVTGSKNLDTGIELSQDVVIGFQLDNGIMQNLTVGAGNYSDAEAVAAAINASIQSSTTLSAENKALFKAQSINGYLQLEYSAEGSDHSITLDNGSSAYDELFRRFTPYEASRNLGTTVETRASGTKDISSVQIVKNQNDNISFYFDNKKFNITLDEGIYNADQLAGHINAKLSGDTLLKNVTAENLGNRLVLSYDSDNDENTHVIDRVGGSAAYSVFYDGTSASKTYVRGQRDLTEGVVITKGTNDAFSFYLDGDQKTIEIAAGNYTADSLKQYLTEELNVFGLSADIDGGRLVLAHNHTGRHTLDRIGGSASPVIFYNDYGSSHENDNLKIQVGANSGNILRLEPPRIHLESLGIEAIQLTSNKLAGQALRKIDHAIQVTSHEQSRMGAYQNALEYITSNVKNANENLTSSESRIRDIDMAKEMINFQKSNILQQAAQAMLAQANQQPQGVLQLLR